VAPSFIFRFYPLKSTVPAVILAYIQFSYLKYIVVHVPAAAASTTTIFPVPESGSTKALSNLIIAPPDVTAVKPEVKSIETASVPGITVAVVETVEEAVPVLAVLAYCFI
jgi:hypothetical protein